jgi:hypothetical protein
MPEVSSFEKDMRPRNENSFPQKSRRSEYLLEKEAELKQEIIPAKRISKGYLSQYGLIVTLGLFSYFKTAPKNFVTRVQASWAAAGLYTFGSLSRKKACPESG